MDYGLVLLSFVAAGVVLIILFNAFGFLDCYDFSWWAEWGVRYVVPVGMLALLVLYIWHPWANTKYLGPSIDRDEEVSVILISMLVLWGPLISIPLYSRLLSLRPMTNKTLLVIGVLSAPLGLIVRAAISRKDLVGPAWDMVMKVLLGTHVVLSIVVYGLVLIFLVSTFFLVARQAALVGAMWPNNE